MTKYACALFDFQKVFHPNFRPKPKKSLILKWCFFSRGSSSIAPGARIERKRIKQTNFGVDTLFRDSELREEQENELGTESEFEFAQSSEAGFAKSSEIAIARPNESEFAEWKTSEFSACSQSCGGGIQTRYVFCKQVGWEPIN